MANLLSISLSSSGTPPEEHFKTVLDEVPLLLCGSHRSSDSISFLNSGYLQRALCTLVQNQTFTSWSLFGQLFTNKHLSNEKEHVFKFLRFQLFQIRNSQTFNSIGCTVSTRKYISKFMQFIFNYVTTVGVTEQSVDIQADVQSLLKVTGRFHQLNREYSFKTQPLLSYYHLLFEMNMHNLLLNIYLFNKERFSSTTFFDTINMAVWDLVYLANKMYRKGDGLNSWNLFTCECVNELWLVVMQALDCFNKRNMCQSFWSVFSDCLNNIGNELEGHYVISSTEYQWNTSIEFKLWCTCKVAPLYLNNDGEIGQSPDKTIVLPGNWQFVEEILHEVFQKDVCEKNIIFYLQACVHLTKYWLPSRPVFKLFCDYICKNMSKSSNKIPSGNISYYAIGENTPRSLLDACLSPNQNTSSFDLFVNLIEVMVAKGKKMASLQLLSQIKGRIYSKFHKKRMESMSLEELQMFTVMFVRCAISFESSDILHKMCSLVTFIEFDLKGPAMRKQIIVTMFTGVMHCKRCSYKIEGVVDKLNDIFQKLVAKVTSKSLVKVKQKQYWDHIPFFFSCIEHCLDMEASNKSCEHLFVSPSYGKLMQLISVHQRSVVFSHINNVFTSSYMRGLMKGALAKQLFANFYPFVDSSAVNVNVPGFVDVLGGFTLLTIHNEYPIKLGDLLKKFAFLPLNPSLKCKYLAKVLCTKELLVTLKSEQHSNNRKLIISCWVVCVLNCQDSDDLVHLTKALFEFDEFQSYINACDSALTGDPEAVLLEFIKGLGAAHSAIQLVMDKSRFAKTIMQYFASVVPICGPLVSTATSKKQLHTIYNVCSSLCCFCSKAIYSKFAPACLLPQFLDLFVLPLTPTKHPLPAQLVTLSTTYLHLFLCGLLTLDAKKDEFINRKQKEILRRYFANCADRSYDDVSSKNPFLFVFEEKTDFLSEKQISDYLVLLLTALKEQHLFLLSPHLQSMLHFVSRLLKLLTNDQHIMMVTEQLLLKILNCLLTCETTKGTGEPPNARCLAMSSFRLMISPTLANQTYHASVVAIISNFAVQKLAINQASLIKTLVLLTDVCNEVVRDVLSLTGEAFEKYGESFELLKRKVRLP